MASHYPGCDLTVEQLLYALNQKLNATTATYISIRETYTPEKLADLEASTASALAEIRACQNAFRPVNGLPSEVLSSIFIFVRDHKIHESWRLSYRWIAVSHVCRYWRNVALGFPSMWSRINSMSTAMAKICLERSKLTPITVSLERNCPDELFVALLSHTSHIRNLSIDIAVAEKTYLLSHFVQSDAPMLYGLSIHLDIEQTDSFPLLFKGHTPSLNRFSACSFAFVEAIPYMVNLTVLCLTKDNQTKSFSMTRFLDVLEANPGLVELRICEAGPESSGGVGNRIIDLRDLKRMNLTNCAVKAILSHVSLPTSAMLRIQSMGVSEDSDFMNQALPDSVEHLENIQGIEIIGISRERYRRSYTVYGDGPNGSLSVDILSQPTGHCLRTFSPLSVVHVHELWLASIKIGKREESQVQTGPIWVLLASMPVLRTIYLLECRSEAFIQALQPTDVVPCTSLEAMIMYDNFDLEWLELVRLAEARKTRGFAFQHLSVIGYPLNWISAAEITLLKKHVVTVLTVDCYGGNTGPTWPFCKWWLEEFG